MAHPLDGWPDGSPRSPLPGALPGESGIETLLGLGLLVAVYGLGWWRLTARVPRHAQVWRAVSYLVGVVAAGLALLPPIDRLAEQRLAVHMIQHLLLIKVTAPCLLLANPLPTVLWGLPGPLRAGLSRLLAPGAPSRAAWRALTAMPLAWLTYAFTLWLWHLPIAYDAALARPLLHVAEHFTFVGAAVLFWWPLIRPAPHVRAGAGASVRVGYLLLAAFHEALLGLLLALSPHPLYRSYDLAAHSVAVDALEDQAWAGVLMWGAGGAADMLSVLALLGQVLGVHNGRAASRDGLGDAVRFAVLAERACEATQDRPDRCHESTPTVGKTPADGDAASRPEDEVTSR